MGKYAPRQSGNVNDRPSRLNPKIHPIWRGVGFALIIIAPLMAYATTELLFAENLTRGWISFPPNWLVQWQDPYILIQAVGTLVLAMVFMAILQMVFFIIMRIFAPPRYGPLDVPPVSFKGKPYKR